VEWNPENRAGTSVLPTLFKQSPQRDFDNGLKKISDLLSIKHLLAFSFNI
jgi:hypothetical protein